MRGTKQSKWKSNDIEKLTGHKPEPHSRAVKIPKQDAKGLAYIKNWLKVEGVEYLEEFVFNPDRKFRFDVAIVDLMVAIEFEGLFSDKSRHTTASGYTTDTIKYNMAQKLGWTVLRYTALNYDQFPDDFRFLKQKK